MTSRITIDRIEGDMAVLEVDGRTWDVPRSALPDGAAEGATLVLALAPSDLSEAEARLARLRARDPNPDSDDIDL